MRRRRERWKLAWSVVLYGTVVAVLTAKAASPEPNVDAQASAAASAEADLREVLAATPNLQQGMKLFQICAECHGPHGAGEASGWPPEIAGQHPHVIAKELTDFRSGLRWYDPMERIAGRHVLHTTQDIADVAAYVGGLPPSTDTAPGAGKNLERGGRMYASRCQWCHGEKGEGSDQGFVPRVAGQQYEYLLRQLQDTVGGRRPNMRAQHIQLLESAHMEELVGLAGYMSRLGSSVGRPLHTRRAALGPRLLSKAAPFLGLRIVEFANLGDRSKVRTEGVPGRDTERVGVYEGCDGKSDGESASAGGWSRQEIGKVRTQPPELPENR